MRGMSHYLAFYTEILNTKVGIKRSGPIKLITVVQLYDHLSQWRGEEETWEMTRSDSDL